MVFFGQLVKQRLKELETAIHREDTVMEFNIHQLSFNLKKKEEDLWHGVIGRYINQKDELQSL